MAVRKVSTHRRLQSSQSSTRSRGVNTSDGDGSADDASLDALDPEASPECDVCKRNHIFKLPANIVQAAKRERLLIFAGAGISTEASTVYPDTLLERIASDLTQKPDPGSSFPAVMSAYEAEHGRRRLLEEIKSRLNYVESFPEVERMATRFHREMATIFCLKEIVTTNWDTLFESATGADPIVIPADYAFWDLPGRKVFKIHGSITNPGTLVITTADYDKCYRGLSRGVIGSSLKHLLAIRTPLFVGYSFGDEDFNRIYKYLRREMGDILPRACIVTTDHRITPDTHDGAMVIHTDATYFMAKLKERLVADDFMVGDDRLDGIPERLIKVANAHDSLRRITSVKAHPSVIFAYAYLDGQRHGFDRMLACRRTGEYSQHHVVHNKVASYEHLRKIAIQRQMYSEAAYILGYEDAPIYWMVPDDLRREAPLYFAHGCGGGFRTQSEYRSALPHLESAHKASFREAKKCAADRLSTTEPHHPPFLDPSLFDHPSLAHVD
jgi:hypothetical protein